MRLEDSKIETAPEAMTRIIEELDDILARLKIVLGAGPKDGSWDVRHQRRVDFVGDTKE